jgi:adenylate kinase family enzyme
MSTLITTCLNCHQNFEAQTKEIKREKALVDAGKLCTPSWVLKITREAVERISKSGSSIVFSGSPRTIFEALGDAKHVGLGNTLKKAFGPKNVTIIKINVRPDATMKRNSIRVSCSVCKLQLMGKLAQKISACPFCSAPLEKREDDDPKVIPARIKEFQERTLPVFEALKKFKFNVIEVDGEKLPFEVFAEIQKKLK